MELKNTSVIVVWALCSFLASTIALKSYPVTTLLNAKYNVTPVCLEIGEYLFDENPNSFWDYVENLNSLQTPLYEIDSDSKAYKSSIQAAESLIGPLQLSLLKLSLSMHSLSPRVQAHFQIANEVIAHGDCKTTSFVTIGSRVACSLDELKKALEKPDLTGAGEDEEIYNFDHIYPGSENNSVATILYSQIGTKDFAQFHEFLKKQTSLGKIKYVSRHYIRNLDTNKVRLSGYGVELHLKSTEYKSQDDSPRTDDQKGSTLNEDDSEVDGFDFKVLKELHPELTSKLDRLKSYLLEKSDEITLLKAWEFQELGLQAAQRVAEIQGDEALQILQFTAQNFPTQAKSLLHQTVSEDFKKEMKYNIDVLGKFLNVQPPDAALFINGLYFDAESLDVNALLETLRSELRVLEGLYKLNIEGSIASELLALDLSTSSAKEFAIDVRDSAITWINDLEKDSQYRRWPSSVMDLLRPTFPGMLRNLRKNLFNLVLVVDPVSPDARAIVKLAESFVVHLAPVRLGIVLDSSKATDLTEATYRAVNCAFNYISQSKSPRDALGFLTDVFAALKSDRHVDLPTVSVQLKKVATDLSTKDLDDILGEDSDYDYGRQVAAEFIERLGFKSSPQALINGVPLQQSSLNSDDFEETLLTEIMQQTPNVQKAVYKGELTDNDVVIDYLMNLPHVMPRLNQRILSADDPNYLDVSGEAHKDLNNLNALAQLTVRDMTATLMQNLKYLTSKHSYENLLGNAISFLTIWVVADAETDNGRSVIKNALSHMKTSGGIRVAFIPNTEGVKVAEKTNLNRLIWAATQTLSSEESTNTVIRWLEQKPTERVIPAAVKELLTETELHLKLLRVYSQRVLKLKSSQIAIISNGKVHGPLDDDEVFTTEDFALIERLSNHHHGDNIRVVLKKYDEDNTSFDKVSKRGNSDKVMKLIALLVPRQQSKSRLSIPSELKEDHTVIKLPPKQSNMPYFDIFAVLDPASRGAQKLAPILTLLRNVVNCNMRVTLCAVDKHSDMPVKNFYRYVIEPELRFQPDGKASAGPYAKFSGLPASPLLTQNLQVPENWLVEVVRSVYDLDNIKLVDINGPVHSEYELEHLLLEGHCFDSTTGAPPRGLQFVLGTKDKPIIVDTIVMANLGYFQLKANPGAWHLKLRHGKSEEIYDITSAEGPNTVHSGETTRVIISSLRSHVLKIRVTKKSGQANADLLGDDTEQQTGIWNSIANSFSGGGSAGEQQQPETINIFSVASGHLYERLLRIMMLSLRKHTKSPVKFWFLKNYLSPQFIDFLPHMAKEYDFQYELVQYKWPRWLHQQTEKQRTIWGYKILFFDVLFPLDVKKIIFVDADAIVRADIAELHNLDLGGAPYAYTPFCDSRKEMEGFRFWKQGYWRNHLQGRRYHISALYVVDLKRFRKIAAGDRLRGQYQALSQDPNSLSNLDQDLPNNMIHQVAIKSLPQEWLWCQTWCSDSTFSKAKVIDLCNNPQTKEAKLTAAQRIVPEWKDYDLEIKNLINRVENEQEVHEEHIDADEDVVAEDEAQAVVKEEEQNKDSDEIKHSEL